MNHTIRLLEDDDYDLNDDGEPEYDFAELRRNAKAEGREYQGQAARRLIRLAPDVAWRGVNEVHLEPIKGGE
ncbi:MAG: hypothetical protein SF097_12875 [Acidobacteriota bacterium]|nr:hypothetical protein [Acidobacteriota bacterium]